MMWTAWKNNKGLYIRNSDGDFKIIMYEKHDERLALAICYVLNGASIPKLQLTDEEMDTLGVPRVEQ